MQSSERRHFLGPPFFFLPLPPPPPPPEPAAPGGFIGTFFFPPVVPEAEAEADAGDGSDVGTGRSSGSAVLALLVDGVGRGEDAVTTEDDAAGDSALAFWSPSPSLPPTTVVDEGWAGGGTG